MDAASFSRVRWRLRGAWMWPTFIVLTAVDAELLHRLPPVGDSLALPGAVVLAFVLNLLAIVVFAPSAGALLRRRRPDMPKLVSSDYAGALGVVMVSVVLAVIGVVHHKVVSSDNAAAGNAERIAQAYIGAHAPAPLQADLAQLDVYAVAPPTIYRVCSSNLARSRWYCVTVTLPRSGRVITGAGSYDGARVRYAGSESNALLSQGTG